MSQNSTHGTANSKAVVSSIKFFAACIIIAAVVYSEILFLGIIGSLFPSGPLAIGAMIGAVTTGLSILALCLGKSHWFRPGQQLIVAWIFTGVEIVVLIMNDILAYQLHTGTQLDQFTSTWRLFCVATPALSLVGWVLLFYFDPQRSIMHKRMEMEDKQAKAKIDLEVTTHDKAMAFHHRAIDMVGSGMEKDMQRLLGPITEIAARQKLAEIASELTGTHISHNQLTGRAPRQLNARIVDADPVEEEEEEEEQEEAASRSHTLDPHKVKSQVDTEKKPVQKKPLIDFSLPKLPRQKGKGTAILTDDRGVTEEKIDTEDYEEEIVEPDYAEEDDKPIQETSTSGNRTRRIGGDREMEAEEDDLMDRPIDDRWQEYSRVNEQPTEDTPVKKKSSTGGRTSSRKPASTSRNPSNSSGRKSTGRASTSSKKQTS